MEATGCAVRRGGFHRGECPVMPEKNVEKIYRQIRKVAETYTHIPDGEWEYFLPSLTIRRFEKKEHLLKADTVADHSFIIVKGLVRIYYVTGSGKEFNRGFAAENNFIGSIASMIKLLPSRFYIQALEDTTAGFIWRAKLEELYERHKCWERLGRLIAENSLIQIEARESDVLDSPEVRYVRFMKKHPDIAARLPQYHIASYLHITDVALSRLRKRIKLI